MIALKPEDETQRLSAVRAYRLTDAALPVELDEIVHLARYICQCPIATVSIIEEFRQCFIAKVGLVLQETPRDVAFCAHTILEKKTLIVPDATKDPRFSDNPLVTADPHLRFYAGVPLINADGCALGTLCVLDKETRSLNFDQVWALESLRKHVVAHLELRRTSMQLKEAMDEIAHLRRNAVNRPR